MSSSKMASRASASPASAHMSAPLTSISSGYADEQYVPDVTVSWLYKPHAVLAICAVMGSILYLAYSTNAEAATWVQNSRTAFVAACVFILVLGMLVFPSGPFIRPHPILWRITFGFAVIYELVLIAILFQSKADARRMMTFFDSSLGVPLVEKSYAADCAFTVANVWSNVDAFVASHFIGWALKALIIRDTATLWTLSIMWEFIEMLFTHMLPNFAECWWDQWLLDVLICNGLGIYVGQQICRRFEMMSYSWKGVHEYPTYSAKARRVLMQFAAPESWVKVRWPKADSLKRFFGMHVLIVAISLEELNAFFLKTLLWLPPTNYLNLTRLFFWFMFSMPCLRQFYLYMTDPTVKSIGRQAFLCVVIILTEVLIIVKMGAGEFNEPMAYQNKVLMWVMIAAYVLYCVRGVYKILSRHPTATQHSELTEQYHLRVAAAESAADAARAAAVAATNAAAVAVAVVASSAAAERRPRSRAAAAAAPTAEASESDSEAEAKAEPKAAARSRSRSRSRAPAKPKAAKDAAKSPARGQSKSRSPARARAGRSATAKTAASESASEGKAKRGAASPARKSASRARPSRKNE